jgi:hypothetical protein
MIYVRRAALTALIAALEFAGRPSEVIGIEQFDVRANKSRLFASSWPTIGAPTFHRCSFSLTTGTPTGLGRAPFVHTVHTAQSRGGTA